MPSYIYPGTEMDFRNIGKVFSEPTGPVILLDLPISFCIDTLLLPSDLYAICIEGRPRYDCNSYSDRPPADMPSGQHSASSESHTVGAEMSPQRKR